MSTTTGLAEEQQRASVVDEPQRREVLDELAVHRGLELEVELVDGPSEREAGVAQPRGHPPVPGGGGLPADELSQERQMRPAVGPGGLGQRGERLRGVPELQVAEVVLELFVDVKGRRILSCGVRRIMSVVAGSIGG